MSEHGYLHSDTNYELELNRLRLVERIYDPTTTFHLEMIEISNGSNCLEIGAGAGFIALWLSKRVGSTGKVVATDVDMRFLKGITTPNLEVRQHDIARDELEEGEFDLVHSRFVLEHLIEPEKALKKMANSVRPGGWLLIEDSDYSPYLYADIVDPSVAFFTSVYRATSDFLRKRGIADSFFGRQVRGLMNRSDL